MKNETNKTYSIELPKLKPGVHHFTFDINDAFFVDKADGIVLGGNLIAKVEVHRAAQHFDIRYIIDGVIQLPCDRCLEPFNFDVHVKNKVIYTYEKSLKSVAEAEVVAISPNLVFLDLSQDLYDFILLSAPMRKVPEDCPKPTCPPEVINLIAPLPEENDINTDDRWDALFQLKNKLN